MTQKSVSPQKFPLKPLSGYAVIEPLEVQTKTTGQGSFTIADEGKKMEAAGTIKAIGEKVPHPTREGLDIECEVQIGDKVAFKRFGSEPFKHMGKEYFHIRFTDILSVIDEN